mmetsp:Transcript_51418/g.159470  ORF Transcript_51418/g.159470 Transcript_51418/m.159470 type:complete len:711 (+) Transcript_51418:226-2358(+)
MSGPCHLRVFDGHGCVDIGPHAGSGGDALDLFLREAQEHLLQGRLHQGVLLDGVRLAGLLEPLEHLAQAQAARAEPRQLVQVARVMRLEEPGLGGQRALDELADLCRGPQVLLVVLRTLPEADLHLVPRPVLQLQVNRGAEAPEAPEHLDADAVAHGLRLLHRVGRDDDRLGLGAHLDGLPQQPLGACINGGRGLVQEEHTAGPDERNGQRQLPLHAAAVLAGGLVRIGSFEPEPVEERADGAVQGVLRYALDPAIEAQVLATRDAVPQRVDLRADAKELVCRSQALRPRDVVAADDEPARTCRPHLAREGCEGRRLARAVRPQEPEALAAAHAQADAAHGRRLQPLPVDLGPVRVAEVQVPHRLLLALAQALQHAALLGKHVLVLPRVARVPYAAGHRGAAAGVLAHQVRGPERDGHERGVQRQRSPGHEDAGDPHVRVVHQDDKHARQSVQRVDDGHHSVDAQRDLVEGARQEQQGHDRRGGDHPEEEVDQGDDLHGHLDGRKQEGEVVGVEEEAHREQEDHEDDEGQRRVRQAYRRPKHDDPGHEQHDGHERRVVREEGADPVRPHGEALRCGHILALLLLVRNEVQYEHDRGDAKRHGRVDCDVVAGVRPEGEGPDDDERRQDHRVVDALPVVRQLLQAHERHRPSAAALGGLRPAPGVRRLGRKLPEVGVGRGAGGGLRLRLLLGRLLELGAPLLQAVSCLPLHR